MSDARIVTVLVEPGDFCVLPMAAPAGLVVDWAEWLQETVDKRRLQSIQKFGHAEVYLGDGLTASAYPNRRGIRPLGCPPEQVPGALWSSGLVPITRDQRDGIVQWCFDHAHVQYAALDYAALTAHSLGWDTGWLQRRIDGEQSMICSQYVDRAYATCNVHLFNDGRWPGFVTPLDLALLLETKGSRP